MSIEKINLNNRLIEPDASGIADLSSLLVNHQSLDEYMKKSELIFCTATQWETLSASADPNTFYFVGE